ncbi:Thiol reductase thioredoxin OS=Streptomyces microflavus OX=1919 GN=G3I39_00360 PE=4 SV=1 [Streptomyces microflavus]
MDGGTPAQRLDASQLGAELGNGRRSSSSPALSASRAGPPAARSWRCPPWFEGVAHIEIDAEAHLTLVRQLGITKTPTVLVLDSAGEVVRRASGQPRTADVVAALGRAI